MNRPDKSPLRFVCSRVIARSRRRRRRREGVYPEGRKETRKDRRSVRPSAGAARSVERSCIRLGCNSPVESLECGQGHALSLFLSLCFFVLAREGVYARAPTPLAASPYHRITGTWRHCLVNYKESEPIFRYRLRNLLRDSFFSPPPPPSPPPFYFYSSSKVIRNSC